jgi:hypothetical protein
MGKERHAANATNAANIEASWNGEWAGNLRSEI